MSDETTINIAPKKVNYLNNKDMLKEIHLSKNSFCEYVDQKYSDYDIIVESIDNLYDPEFQENAQRGRATRLSTLAYDAATLSFINSKSISKTDKPKLSEFKFDHLTVDINDAVFRVLTFDHIPLSPGRKKNPKSTSDNHSKLNFDPFKHYVLDNGIAKEVGRSHSKNGKFSLDHGAITNKLAKMFILLVNKYGQSFNWRSYTYLEEMKGQALLQLSQIGLKFDEYKSDNPFAYYTAIMSNSFTRVLHLEKKNQDIRDDLLINNGAIPSFSRQLDVEEEIRRLREDAQDASKTDF
jgi:hypothetical protein